MTGKAQRALCALLAVSALIAGTTTAARAGELFDEATLAFARAVDLHDWRRLAVRHGGRFKTFDSFARSQLGLFYGQGEIDRTSPTFAFLELYLNAGAYLEKPVISVREKRLRSRLAALMPAGAESLQKTHRLAPIDLLTFGQVELLVATGRAEPRHVDPNRIDSLAAALEKLQGDLSVRSALGRLFARIDAFLAAGSVRLVPVGDGQVRYVDPTMLFDAGHPDLGDAAAADLRRGYVALARSWRDRDAGATNALLHELCDALIARGGQAYPSAWRRELEMFHDRIFGFSIAWIGYAVAAGLLLAAAAGIRGARRFRAAGMAAFALSTVFLGAGWCLRWYLSARGWQLPPLTNQYETVLGAALTAALAAAVLEVVFKKGIFALAASLVATAALLAAFFQPAALGADINAPAAILVTAILGWHVATLVIAYAMIGMSLVLSLAYVGVWAFKARPGVLLGDLDRSNLILVQLACWLLAVGVALGAYWGDKAWGRWWGWDPKETWGLMTFLVYLAIVHLRFVLRPRRRGLWTAILAILGCAVMGFAWWGVNYLLVGLHSYA